MSLFRDIAFAVKRLFGVELATVHTHIPCQVISFNAATNTCKLQPCLMRMRADDPNNFEEVQLPVLEDVPVQQLGSGTLFLSVAPAADSYGDLHVQERSIANWILKGGVVAPGTARKFDLADGFFVPSIGLCVPDLPVGPILADRIALRDKVGTTFVAVLDDGTVEISNPLGTITIDVTGIISVDGVQVVLMGGADWAVQYTALKAAFDAFVANFNTFIGVYDAHIHITTATVGVGPVGVISPTVATGTPTAADMSGSKVDTVNLP